ncbi:MAG: bifunctional UDP-sugar hydrolase/5'-nucleotidase [Syntrophales bacterium]|nr:bifunctional UDP-sugar hydrolase/5'-nucleotidase [Syntrophales bacterium]
MIKPSRSAIKAVTIALSVMLLIAATITGCRRSNVDVAIITTADLQSKVVPYDTKIEVDGKDQKIAVGGLERISSLAKKIKSEVDCSLFVSTGDDLIGAFYDKFKGIPEIKAMNMAGYDVATPGNHEFDFGVDHYVGAIKNARFDIVSSNLIIRNEALSKLIKPYIIKEIKGLKIGVFGLMTPELSEVSNVGDGVSVDKDIVGVAKKMVETLKKKGATMIVALTHIGTQLDRELAKKVEGIHVIVGGHSHEYVYETVVGPNGWKTVIVQDGACGEKMGVLRFKFNGIVNNPKWQTVILDKSVGKDEKTKEFLAVYVDKYNENLKNPIGISLTDLDARRNTVRRKESILGNLITDSWTHWFKTKGKDVDVALINGGALRGDRVYPAGPVTLGDLIEIYPFGDTVMEATLNGVQLLQILEISASSLRVPGDECSGGSRAQEGGFLQVSGVRLDIDTANKPFCAVYGGRDVKKILSKGKRVVKAEILENGAWKSIEKNKEYNVLMNSWLASGGDGYYMFRGIKNKKDTTFSIVDLLFLYIKKNSPINPQLEGRINIR